MKDLVQIRHKKTDGKVLSKMWRIWSKSVTKTLTGSVASKKCDGFGLNPSQKKSDWKCCLQKNVTNLVQIRYKKIDWKCSQKKCDGFGPNPSQKNRWRCPLKFVTDLEQIRHKKSEPKSHLKTCCWSSQTLIKNLFSGRCDLTKKHTVKGLAFSTTKFFVWLIEDLVQ